MNQGFANESVASDELQMIMDDYNTNFGTAFTTDNFSAYYDDVNERMKKRKKDMEPLDLLLVVGMFLTGFDAKKLNTLYVDKNLEYHGLLQAFSRTNRVLNEKKRFGKVVCFRDLKNKVDASIRLFSNNEPNEFIIREPYEKVRKELNIKMIDFLEKFPNPAYIDSLQSEYDKRKFILAFREIIRGKIEVQIYEDYNADDPYFIMSEQEYMDFRSKYLDITIGVIDDKSDSSVNAVGEPPVEYGDAKIEDIDFCLELLHSDVINVAYILALIEDLNPDSEDYDQKRQHILDTMIKDAAMRSKTKLIDGFIKRNVDNDKAGFQRAKADGSVDLEGRLREYITEAKNQAIADLAESEGLSADALAEFFREYDYLQREKIEIVQEAIKQKRVGLVERRNILKRVMTKLRAIIDTFNWD